MDILCSSFLKLYKNVEWCWIWLNAYIASINEGQNRIKVRSWMIQRYKYKRYDKRYKPPKRREL